MARRQVPIAVAVLVLWVTGPADAQRSVERSARSANITISVVATTDLHGGVLPRGERGGLALLGGYVRNVRAARLRDGGGTLLVDSGDMFQGTLESNLNEGAAVVQTAADASIDRARPGDWTHAVMDVGATLCRPTRPRCEECPLVGWCRFAAQAEGGPALRPPTGADRQAREPFRASTRWLRGRIVDQLRDADGASWTYLEAPIGDHDDAAIEAALGALARDGIVELDPIATRRARLAMA